MPDFNGPMLTWTDVARQFASSKSLVSGQTTGVVRARVTWDDITLEVANDLDVEKITTWLASVFPGRLKSDPLRIALDGPIHLGTLPVHTEVATLSPRFRPFFGIIDGIIDFRKLGPPTAQRRPVPVVAVLSVKGGTGRTTTAVATALEWARLAGAPVLLVDGDLDAPGISYLFKDVGRETHVSLEDVIALAHADESAQAEDTVTFVAERLRDHMISGNLCILPLRRDIDELASSAIRPEHLSTPEHPFALADILSMIAERLSCAGVVVDVRAGLVPLGVNLAMDPEVSPVVVTTLSSQALQATASLMRFLGREMRRAGSISRNPLIVINRVPMLFMQSGMDKKMIEPLLEDVMATLVPDQQEIVSSSEGLFDKSLDLEPFSIVEVPELAELQISAANWTAFLAQINSSGFASTLSLGLVRWISTELMLPAATLSATVVEPPLADVSKRRSQLADYAELLISAESAKGKVAKPLVTRPLATLAERFQAEMPIAISEGGKGTGKTLAARFLTDQLTWDVAVKSLIGKSGVRPAFIIPVCASIQASSAFQAEVDDARRRIARSFKLANPVGVYETTALLKASFTEVPTEASWVELWLDLTAWSVGFEPHKTGAGTRFIDYLRTTGTNAIALVEGLEELYPSSSDSHVAIAMRAALVGLPQRLRTELRRPLGMIAFSRRDTVEAAIRQNLDQFRREYAGFALTWTEDDVLELAAWLGTQANATPSLWTSSFSANPQEEKARQLEPLWGRKLGPDDQFDKRTREAYTATWVVAVLSDLRGRLVPRDLVRLLGSAARVSTGVEEQNEYFGRLLIPRALKSAVEPTSLRKVAETEEEISELKPIFDKFRAHAEEFEVPISQRGFDAMDIDKNEVETLQRHGIVFGDSSPYEVPELFRRGLGLRHAGARRSVVNLYRKARQRIT